jgi:hypothetical protein
MDALRAELRELNVVIASTFFDGAMPYQDQDQNQDQDQDQGQGQDEDQGKQEDDKPKSTTKIKYQSKTKIRKKKRKKNKKTDFLEGAVAESQEGDKLRVEMVSVTDATHELCGSRSGSDHKRDTVSEGEGLGQGLPTRTNELRKKQEEARRALEEFEQAQLVVDMLRDRWLFLQRDVQHIEAEDTFLNTKL